MNDAVGLMVVGFLGVEGVSRYGHAEPEHATISIPEHVAEQIRENKTSAKENAGVSVEIDKRLTSVEKDIGIIAMVCAKFDKERDEQNKALSAQTELMRKIHTALDKINNNTNRDGGGDHR